MLIIDGEDKELLLKHLKIVKMYYRQQARLFEGLKLGEAHQECYHNVSDFIRRMEAEHETH